MYVVVSMLVCVQHFCTITCKVVISISIIHEAIVFVQCWLVCSSSICLVVVFVQQYVCSSTTTVSPLCPLYGGDRIDHWGDTTLHNMVYTTTHHTTQHSIHHYTPLHYYTTTISCHMVRYSYLYCKLFKQYSHHNYINYQLSSCYPIIK